MSKGVPPRAWAASGSGANAKVASGSTNRRMSHAEAVRSMCGRGLVTQSTAGSFPDRSGFRGVQFRDCPSHPSGCRVAAGGLEVVPAALEPEGALQTLELPDGVREH